MPPRASVPPLVVTPPADGLRGSRRQDLPALAPPHSPGRLLSPRSERAEDLSSFQSDGSQDASPKKTLPRKSQLDKVKDNVRNALERIQQWRNGEGQRLVQLFNLDPKHTNRVVTAKYTWWSFPFLNLAEQLSQLANAYFLLVAILQMVKPISNTGGAPMTLIPLSFVLLLGAVKDGFEDYQRHCSDNRENMGTATVADRGNEDPEDLKFSNTAWQDLRCGHLVRVCDGDRVPCDGLLLASSNPGGLCFVETANLDGESNLKKKTAVLSEEEWSETLQRADQELLELECEAPSVDLYSFKGRIRAVDGEIRGVNISNLVLRGTSLQQTDWALLMAVYVGHETRSMMNSRKARYKPSTLDISLSKVVVMVFSLQLLLCIFLSVCAFVWDLYHAPTNWYLDMASGASLITVVERAGTWVLQTNAMVPISLMVTMTVVKFIQGRFVMWDEGCGDVARGKGARVNTSQVIESLGQITHVFSDKTGTLTQNVMEYKACSVAGTIYGLECDTPEPRLSIEVAQPAPVPRNRVRGPHVDFEAGALFRDLEGPAATGRPTAIAAFMLAHGVCHTVEAAKEQVNATLSYVRGGVFGDTPPYKASSPDELALVCAARALGLEFLRLTPDNRAELDVRGVGMIAAINTVCGATVNPKDGGTLGVEVLDVCEFDNDRKRMSVVVRYPNGRLVLLLKGADTSVLPYVAGCMGLNKSSEQASSLVDSHLSVFARRGLRTLCIAYRELREEEYADWHSRFMEAQAVLEDDKVERIQKLAIEIEVEGPKLTLLGATAIEDRLQEEVPETIEQLRKAGMRVWVLTGDKVETAISIARSCRLLVDGMENVIMESTDDEEVDEALRKALASPNPALTVAAAALAVVLASDSRKRIFAEVAQRCRSVVCCRVSPKQKADVVQLVRSYVASAVTLSIGDGANDVSMIVTAHVGVGLSGKEGAQAAATADFAISEFKLLRRLLFVHGRESYRRMSVLVLYNFYKNMLMVMPTILSADRAGFSGQNVFSPLVQQMYNVLYTHLPVCVYGFMDREREDVDEMEMDARNYAPRLFSNSITLVWIVTAMAQAVMYSYSMFSMLGEGRAEGGVELGDLFTSGDLRFIWVVLGANLTMARQATTWHPWTVLLYGFNVAMIIVSIFILQIFSRPHQTWDAIVGPDWLRIALATIAVLALHFLIDAALVDHSRPLDEIMVRAHTLARKATGLHQEEEDVLTPFMTQRPTAKDVGTPSQPLLDSSASRPSKSGLARSNSGFAFSEECQLERGRASRSANSPSHNSERSLSPNARLSRSASRGRLTGDTDARTASWIEMQRAPHRDEEQGLSPQRPAPT